MGEHQQAVDHQRDRCGRLALGEGDLGHVMGLVVSEKSRRRAEGPGGECEPEHSFHEARVSQLTVRGQGQKEAGNANREAADQSEVPRKKREGECQETGPEGQQHRVDGLGQKQIRNSLHIVDNASALGNDVRQHCERPVEQHELGDRARRRRSGAHGYAYVGVLKGEDVVDPVARPKTVWASRAEARSPS